jgi:hypothetical protein
MSAFQKAERRQAKLKLGIMSPSGGGKTKSALRLAVGIGGKIAVIDTENNSASLYADQFDFDTLNIEPPFTANKYVEAIKLAEREGYDTIIVDSFSHAWAGAGGTLDRKAALDARGGNNFSNWKNPKEEYAKVKNAILQSSCHVICCIRSKQAYVLVDDNGKQKPQKMGLDPIAEPNIEYEFTTVFEIAMDHNAVASKDRTDLFDKQIFLITEETGQKLIKWLLEAKPEESFHKEPDAQEPKYKWDKPEGAGVEAQSPKAKPSGVFCNLCQSEVILHSNGSAYVCPKRSKKADGHLAFILSELGKYQAQQSA